MSGHKPRAFLVDEKSVVEGYEEKMKRAQEKALRQRYEETHGRVEPMEIPASRSSAPVTK